MSHRHCVYTHVNLPFFFSYFHGVAVFVESGKNTFSNNFPLPVARKKLLFKRKQIFHCHLRQNFIVCRYYAVVIFLYQCHVTPLYLSYSPEVPI